MKERPIIFSGPMVKAILDGWKTQTRRICKVQPTAISDGFDLTDTLTAGCPYGKPGDRLWVKEAAYIAPKRFSGHPEDGNCFDVDGDWRIVAYEASICADTIRCANDYGVKRTPSIFMPRWASRLTLEIISVRVERLQDITEKDAKAEGVDAIPVAAIKRPGTLTHRADFAQLWNLINGKKAPWDSNPFVWVIEFKTVEVDNG